MTIKELAEFTGKNKSTITRWVAKCNSKITDRVQGSTKYNPVDFSIDEIEEILNAGSMSKDAVNILMQNARKPTQIEAALINPSSLELTLIKMIEQNNKIMSMMIMKMDSFDNSISVNNSQSKKMLLPPVPDIEPRLYLNQLVREYAELKGVEFRNAWNVLYTEILYRCNTNVKVKAKNEGLKPIAYLEKANMLLTACSIVKGLING